MVSLNPCATATEWLRATLPNGDIVSLTKNVTASSGSKDYIVNKNGQPFDNMALTTAAFDPLTSRFFGVNAAGTYYESVNGAPWAQVSTDKLTTAPYDTLTPSLVQTDSYPNGVSIVPCGSLPPTPILPTVEPTVKPTVKPTPKPSSGWSTGTIIVLSAGLGLLLLILIGTGLALHARRKQQEAATQRLRTTAPSPGAMYDSDAYDADWPL